MIVHALLCLADLFYFTINRKLRLAGDMVESLGPGPEMLACFA